MAIRIGTSGWAYEDWEGHVYPKGLAPTDRLHWYAERFPTVEVDSTYYRDPAPGVVHGWVQKTADIKDFELSVKAPKDVTHALMVDGEPDQLARRLDAWRRLVADPLAQGRRLGAVLLQLSPAVVHHPSSLRRLRAALLALRPLQIAVEFRNRTWHDDAGAHLAGDVRELLDAHDAAAVLVDGPPFPPIVAGTAPHAFVRFHGRNADRWYKEERYYGDRYDYLYSEEELAGWVPRLAKLAREKETVRVFFNNHVEGKAFNNGRVMEDLLEREGLPVVHARSPQTRLPF